MTIEKPQFQTRRDASRAFLSDARDNLESLKEKELTLNELQEELRKIVTSLTASISRRDIDVGNKEDELIAIGLAFKNTKTLSEDDVDIYLSRIETKI